MTQWKSAAIARTILSVLESAVAGIKLQNSEVYYEKEKLLMMSPNKPYNTKDSSEYFAEFYKEYCLDQLH